MDLPAEIRDWVETTCGGRVVAAKRHHAGASRMAWSLDVDREGTGEALFLLKDKGEGGGSLRDAAVLCALAKTDVPVPEVVGLSSAPSMILLERLPGRSDFPAVDREEEREPTARHLMALTARLHALDTSEMQIDHLTLPEESGESARTTLAQMRGAHSALGDAADPFFAFAIGCLEENRPTGKTRISLIHSDMGPGNFLYESGRVTGIVDWEVAHFGDPMEDLAAIAVRDMATPVGDLSKRFSEYTEASGTEVDLDRVEYYRALVLTRNSLMIGLGLASPPEGFDVAEMTMYQTLLMRAAALVFCDLQGIERPDAELAQDAASHPAAAPEEDEAILLSESASAPAETLAPLFARRMHRLAHERRALMGPMIDRFPQRLEKR